MNEVLGDLRYTFAKLDDGVATKITRHFRVPVESIAYGKVRLSYPTLNMILMCIIRGQVLTDILWISFANERGRNRKKICYRF